MVEERDDGRGAWKASESDAFEQRGEGLARVSEGHPFQQRFGLLSSASARMEALLEVPEQLAERDPLELYDLIAELGLDDAMELAIQASPEQLQGFVDFDGWRGERFEASSISRWIDVILAKDDEAFVEAFEQLDPELLPLYFQSMLRVELRDEDDPVLAGEEEATFEPSPDGAYLVQYPQDQAEAERCRALLLRIYQTMGVMKGWMMMEATRWELPSEMEETALRFRNARLEDYGFRSFDEARRALSMVDPERERERLRALDGEPLLFVRAPMPSHLRQALAELDDEGLFLARCSARLSEPEWLQFEAQLVSLCGLVCCAQRVEASDRFEQQRVILQVTSWLSVALEYLAERELEQGVKLLRVAALRELYRVASSLLERLRRRARNLLDAAQSTVVDGELASLLNEEQQDLVEGLLHSVPLRSALGAQHFDRYAQVEQSARLLVDLAFEQLLFYSVLAIEPAQLAALAYSPKLFGGPQQLTFERAFATLVWREYRGLQPPLGALLAEELPEDAEDWARALEAWPVPRLLSAGPSSAGMRAAAARFLGRVAARVREELPARAREAELSFVGGLLLCSP
ncbi:MAG: DUF6178 family protein [Myxococcota bacterium]|jgi:hypothetical protein|nr:DUF6178 family protein [Myxococcota bacterium]